MQSPLSPANLSQIGPSTISAFSYYNDILDTVDEKEEAGFNTTLTDYWTRALSYQFLDPHDGGPCMFPLLAIIIS